MKGGDVLIWIGRPWFSLVVFAACWCRLIGCGKAWLEMLHTASCIRPILWPDTWSSLALPLQLFTACPWTHNSQSRSGTTPLSTNSHKCQSLLCLLLLRVVSSSLKSWPMPYFCTNFKCAQMAESWTFGSERSVRIHTVRTRPYQIRTASP